MPLYSRIGAYHKRNLWKRVVRLKWRRRAREGAIVLAIEPQSRHFLDAFLGGFVVWMLNQFLPTQYDCELYEI